MEAIVTAKYKMKINGNSRYRERLSDTLRISQSRRTEMVTLLRAGHNHHSLEDSYTVEKDWMVYASLCLPRKMD